MRAKRTWAAAWLPVAVVALLSALPAGVSGSRTVRVPKSSLRLVASISPNLPSGPTTPVSLFGFNDFHGSLRPGTAGSVDGIPAGGAPQFARALTVLRSTALFSAAVGAGDMVGGSPLDSALFNDEPTELILGAMNIDLTSVGNHEFDEGRAELVRKQIGGCEIVPGDLQDCVFADPGNPTPPPVYPGTVMQYLAANVVDTATGVPLFPPYAIKTFGPAKVGFIGLALKGTPQIVTPSGVAGLTFLDEAPTANSYVDDLQAQGVNTIVALIHQGGVQDTRTTMNTCNGLSGELLPIVAQLDAAIPIVISGHTHAEYNCAIPTPVGDKLVTSALSNGRVITDIDLVIDNATGILSSATANNVIVDTAANTLPPGSPLRESVYNRVEEIQQAAANQSAPVAGQVVGSITADITRATTPAGESAMGDVIADVQLQASDPARLPAASAVIAFTNPGGLRQDLLVDQVSATETPGQVTYGEAFAAQPFGNSLVTKTLTGEQIRRLLNQQLPGCEGQTTKRILQVSAGFTYTMDETRPGACDKVDPATIRLNGTPLVPGDAYRVTMNSFLAAGGDGFAVFNEGIETVGGAQDIDALSAYFAANPAGVGPGPRDRITLVTAPAARGRRSSLALMLPVSGVLMMGGGALLMASGRRRPVAVLR